MMNLDVTPFAPSDTPARPEPPPYLPAHDLYGVVHKGLRWAMFRTLERVARSDSGDPEATAAALAEVRDLLDLLHSHLRHENDFIHVALEARRPGASARLAADHQHHEAAIGDLCGLVTAVERCSPAARPARWRELHLKLTVFVGENLVHMEEEENLAQPVLEELYSVAELADIELRLVSSVAPDRMVRILAPMVVAITPEERVALLSGPRSAMPPEAFDGLFAVATRHLAEDERGALRHRLSETS